MKASKLIINVYILLFMLVAFAGMEKVFIFNYTAEIMALSNILLVAGLFISRKHFGISDKKGSLILYSLIYIYIVLDYLFWTLYKTSTMAYVKRFLFYYPMLFITLEKEVLSKIINISKKYVLLIAIVFVFKYPIMGVNGSFLGSYQNVASALSAGLLFLIVELLFENKYRIFDGLAFIITSGALLMTGKRTFTVIPVLILVVFIFTRELKVISKLKRIFCIGIPMALFGSLVLLIYPKAFLAIQRLAEASQEENMNGRTGFWNLAIYLWENNKLFGIGMGTFQDYISLNKAFTFKMFRVQAAYAAHNIYYQMLAEIGSIGFALFIIFFLFNIVTTIKALFKKNKEKQDTKLLYTSLFLQIWFLLYGYTGNPLYMVNQFFLYLFAIMITQSVRKSNKEVLSK